MHWPAEGQSGEASPFNLKLSYFVHFDEVHNNQRRASFFPIITRGN